MILLLECQIKSMFSFFSNSVTSSLLRKNVFFEKLSQLTISQNVPDSFHTFFQQQILQNHQHTVYNEFQIGANENIKKRRRPRIDPSVLHHLSRRKMRNIGLQYLNQLHPSKQIVSKPFTKTPATPKSHSFLNIIYIYHDWYVLSNALLRS